MTRKQVILSLIPFSLLGKQKWIVFDLQDVIKAWFYKNYPVQNAKETRHELFTVCYEWLEKARLSGKIAGHRVWCNENNNTKEVIERGEFIAQINIRSVSTHNVKELHVLIKDGKELSFKVI